MLEVDIYMVCRRQRQYELGIKGQGKMQIKAVFMACITNSFRC